MAIRRIKNGEPTIRLIMSDGSERSTYMPQEMALGWLGAPHATVNLMTEYYPKRTSWPERRLDSEKVYHYRHGPGNPKSATYQADLEDWSDGYYSFDIANPRNDVVQQMEDVRRYGQDVRVTLTAEADTTDEDLVRLAEAMKPFGPVEVRLNHEAGLNNTWFRFARNVGRMSPENARPVLYEISQFFIRAKRTMTAVAPQLVFVVCGDRGRASEDDMMGLMIKEPGTIMCIDNYGSLHYGWPGHRIENPPIIGKPDPGRDHAVGRCTWEVCEGFRRFHEEMSELRGAPARLDLGEFNYDEDIHGPEIRAQLLYECYVWFAAHPQVIGSIVHYELTDRGGLGLLHEPEYERLEDVIPSKPVLEMYKDVMNWPQYRLPVNEAGPVEEGAERVALLWHSTMDSDGLEVDLQAGAKAVDLRESYWRRVVFLDAAGRETFLHTDAVQVDVPEGAVKARVYALPPDGRDNCAEGYRAEVPVPSVIG